MKKDSGQQANYTIWSSLPSRAIVAVGAVPLAVAFVAIQLAEGFDGNENSVGFAVFMLAWFTLVWRLLQIRVTAHADGVLYVHNFFRTHKLDRSAVSAFDIRISGPTIMQQEMVVATTSDSKFVDLEATRRLRPKGTQHVSEKHISVLQTWLHHEGH